ncbi:amino acid adenylation domain-containing protein/thioester reductase-like protein [Paenibacillus shirakamiensis]|uniref:Amino acid adenylation domain-containing protein/thioester reductase-like protein n=1 Tax=Paenibacillus shirakamiensis TaxID=1265935 RepID=A0ABS4JEU1_9BACL|nr:non-ribosomal peptide synthetase [Paenibacillus shirakamiensis]MBP2000232.1 amino acid adenylation domain-containing protein/thioester reductase-like protein [Paenibacillus shirakamiensis]
MNSTMLIDHNKEYILQELQLPLPGFHLYTEESSHNADFSIQSMEIPLYIRLEEQEHCRRSYDFETCMLTSYVIFLHRMTSDPDLLIGVKTKQGNLLPLRINLQSTDTFRNVYGQIAVKLDRLQAMLYTNENMEEMIGQAIHYPAVYGFADASSSHGLNWYVQEEPERWVLHISFASNLYNEPLILKYSQHFQHLLNGALQQADLMIGRLPIITEVDVATYAELNDTKRELPEEATLVAMFRSIVNQFPNHIALSEGQDHLSYKELDRASNQVAHMLLSQGLDKGQFVSIFMKRSLSTIVSLLGVLKAGGAYIPLDPAHPDERNAYIIEDTKSSIILTQHEFLPKLAGLLSDFEAKPQLFCVDDVRHNYSEEACHVLNQPEDLAYVIYTSGSTGKPKGALIGHKGVVNLALSTQASLHLTEEDIILQYATFSFDASVYDIFSSLVSGANLHLLSDEERFSIDAFTEAVEETGATRVSILPTVFFNQLATYILLEDTDKYRNIKSIVVGGEALSGETVRLFQRKLQIPVVNLYGPTEITVVATGHTVDYPVPENLSSIYIGTPLTNYELYIVNEQNELCPTCVTGELLISSVGIGKGYLNQPEKTKEVFISDPIHPDSGKKFYRSGDMVRLLPHGQVEYRGRKDAQVKIRGFRIELGEIEDNLAKHHAIKDIAVLPKTDEEGSKMLAAFYTSHDGLAVSHMDLVQFLSKKVPNYMVPKHFCFIEDMPLSPTGKIDRKKLDLLEISMPPLDSEYIPPVNELQWEISRAWEKALGQTNISIHDDFFDMGGYSLKILEILVVLKPSFPQLKINDFFVYPTIATLSQRIEELIASGVPQMQVDLTLPQQPLAEFPEYFYGVPKTDRVLSDQQCILLTGATGYLGSHLLYELLHQSTEATIYCLVRPSEEQQPFDRLVQVMKGYFGEEIAERMQRRVLAIEGDLEKDNLGLSMLNRIIVDEQIDSIIHCGAEVKHFGDAEYFTRVNVDSTNRLLDMARRKPQIRFHFISTLGIPEDLAAGGQWESIVDGSGYETSAIDNVYTNSKLEAEKLVVRAGQEGIAASIYRVGNLSCNSTNGIFQKNMDHNAFVRMLKAMLLLKKAPKVKWEVDVTPINYAGASITSLLLQQTTVGRMFHICNPVSVPYEQMVNYFRDYGYEIALLDWKEYEAWVLDLGQAKDQEGLELAMAQLEGDGAKDSIFRYVCPQTSTYLVGTGVECAEPNEHFFKKLIDYAIQIGYFNPPELLV